jgi:hypothetical protein
LSVRPNAPRVIILPAAPVAVAVAAKR